MAKTALAAQEIRSVLISGLDVFNGPPPGRDLIKSPPGDDETMAQLGVPPGELDTVVRAWVNARFRRPAGLPLLLSGDITSDTTFAELLALCQPDAGAKK